MFFQVLDSEQDQEVVDTLHNQQEIEDLFDELEDLSDSGPEMDNLSVLSTPKPSLRSAPVIMFVVASYSYLLIITKSFFLVCWHWLSSITVFNLFLMKRITVNIIV